MFSSLEGLSACATIHCKALSTVPQQLFHHSSTILYSRGLFRLLCHFLTGELLYLLFNNNWIHVDIQLSYRSFTEMFSVKSNGRLRAVQNWLEMLFPPIAHLSSCVLDASPFAIWLAESVVNCHSSLRLFCTVSWSHQSLQEVMPQKVYLLPIFSYRLRISSLLFYLWHDIRNFFWKACSVLPFNNLRSSMAFHVLSEIQASFLVPLLKLITFLAASVMLSLNTSHVRSTHSSLSCKLSSISDASSKLKRFSIATQNFV